MVIILLLNVTDNREVLNNFKRRKKQEREWRDILRRCCQVREGRLIFEEDLGLECPAKQKCLRQKDH